MTRGWPARHAQLALVDPQAAPQRLPPHDAQRIGRALEVWRITGKPLSSIFGKTFRVAGPRMGLLFLGAAEPRMAAPTHCATL
jgi:tRNA dimethylallyltransferase